MCVCVCVRVCVCACVRACVNVHIVAIGCINPVDESGTAKKPAKGRSSPSSSKTERIVQSGSVIPSTTSLSCEVSVV